jgi:signal transduction histidine kinase
VSACQPVTAERRIQSERLESLGRFAGGIAHDFNNLLCVIANCAEFVHGRVAEGSLIAQTETIIDSAERAAGLVRQLLAFCRQEPAAPERLQLDTVVAGIEPLLRCAVSERIRIRRHMQDGLWPVWADAGQIEQVIVNLVLNARDAMPDGGELGLATDNVIHTAAGPPGDGALPPGAYVCLTVTDEGTGMSPEVAARAIEPFFTTRGTNGGTGLGLATVDRLLRAAGGALELESELGRGTVVRAYLPVA